MTCIYGPVLEFKLPLLTFFSSGMQFVGSSLSSPPPCAPWPIWAKGTSPKRPMRQEIRERKSPKRGRHLRGALGRWDSSLAAPFLGGRAKAAPPPSPLALYIVGGREGSPT